MSGSAVHLKHWNKMDAPPSYKSTEVSMNDGAYRTTDAGNTNLGYQSDSSPENGGVSETPFSDVQDGIKPKEAGVCIKS